MLLFSSKASLYGLHMDNVADKTSGYWNALDILETVDRLLE
jgi:hypothetical protein